MIESVQRAGEFPYSRNISSRKCLKSHATVDSLSSRGFVRAAKRNQRESGEVNSLPSSLSLCIAFGNLTINYTKVVCCKEHTGANNSFLFAPDLLRQRDDEASPARFSLFSSFARPRAQKFKSDANYRLSVAPLRGIRSWCGPFFFWYFTFDNVY